MPQPRIVDCSSPTLLQDRSTTGYPSRASPVLDLAKACIYANHPIYTLFADGALTEVKHEPCIELTELGNSERRIHTHVGSFIAIDLGRSNRSASWS